VDAVRDGVSDMSGWVLGLGWLTVSAGLLSFVCLACALLDSYTSQCVIGGTLGHIGQAAACPDFGGWDTRVFPIAVDTGWGSALFAVLRLARAIGMRNWRWRVVLLFELLTALFTVAGNAFHGLALDGATAQFSAVANQIIGAVASGVPGVVAVGSGFTLTVLISTGRLSLPLVDTGANAAPVDPSPVARVDIPAPDQPQPSTVTVERVPDTWIGVRSADGQWWWDGGQWRPANPPAVVADVRPDAASQYPPTVVDAPAGAQVDTSVPIRPTPSTDRPPTEPVSERRAALCTWLREQTDAGRKVADISVSEAARGTGIARTSILRWLDGAPLSTLLPAMSGQEAAA
jgi:hypothetical protein